MSRQSTRLEVALDGTKWTVREHGIGRLTSHPSQETAENAARALAALHTPCELVLRNADGTVSKTEHYPQR